jgi:predicted RNA-binding Zn ribbon-like protein
VRVEVQAEPQPGNRRPAPGELGLVQAFMNTRWDLESPRRDDRFTNPHALADWLRDRDLIDPEAKVGEDDLARVLAIREGLRALAFANNGHQLDPAATAAMEAASGGAAAEVRIGAAGPSFAPVRATGTTGAIGALLARVAAAMLDGSWERLKACPGRDCGWVFYDGSRNLSARWCSMRVCGDRAKARAYYRRRHGSAAG